MRSVAIGLTEPEDHLEALTGTIKALIQKQFNISPDQIDPSAPFAEYNVDSLGLAELAAGIEDHFGISFPPTSLARATNFNELVILVQELQA